MLTLINLCISAQIILHEAANITQSTATLSADFPNLNAEHGFQYKYGTLPQIDEFSKVALSPYSDPVQLDTDNWRIRSGKGYVENLSGLSGTITTTIVLYKATTISFDWSIDAQEGCAYLRFCQESVLGSSSGIRYVEIERISGDHPFSKFSIQLSEGEHHLKWEYVQVTPSSVGLDIAQIKNITIENTLPGEWKNVIIPDSEVTLENLIPNSNVLYQAFENGSNTLSKINTFTTDSIDIEPSYISSLTQTTATITNNTGNSEVVLEKGVNYVYISPLLSNLVADTTDCSGMTISASDKWKALNGRVEYNVTTESGFVYGTIILTLTVSGEKYAKSKIEFDITNDGTYFSGCYFGLFLDNNKNVNQTFPKGSGHYSIELTSGSHILTFKTQRQNSSASGGTVSISGLRGQNIVGAESFNTVYSETSDVKLENLKPDNTYMAQGFVRPLEYSAEPQAWQGETSPWFRINTLPVIVKSDTCNVRQSSLTINGIVDKGDASISYAGVQYRALNGTWISLIADNNASSFSHNISRLKPGTEYECRAYATPVDCDTVFSNIIKFQTKEVIAKKPTIIKLSQHEAILLGEVIFGDANIYRCGMQFRKSDSSTWEEIEDDGESSTFSLVKKNLEMGVSYQTRTFVQAAGCDVIYSEILEFTTLDTYFLSCNSDVCTQISVTLEASLADVDEGTIIENYGFEYYIDSDGFFENADSFVKSELFDVPVTPIDNKLKTIITGLAPSMRICWRVYAIIDGTKFYYSGIYNSEWNFAQTDKATIKVSVQSITQTTITLELNTSQNGDAHVSKIEYALANSLQDTQIYSTCGNILTLSNLNPDTQYNLRFRGTVNNMLCPLLKDLNWDYSWFEYKTLPVTVDVSFNNITQTKALMKVQVNSGDATVTNLRYQLGHGEIQPCSEYNSLINLQPGQKHNVTIYANVNGVEKYWTTSASDSPFEFTTKSVTTSVSASEIFQTSAIISWSSNIGDATFIASGLEINEVTYQSDEPSGVKVCTELLPNKTYSYRSYVETVESGRIYSSSHSLTTKIIVCQTLPVSNISNRSATMNGTIECDDLSSAEFGFQWKQMEGWLSDPAYTKGHKLEDGSIAVSLVNGMLEPNTDYQYRTAVRYLGNIYFASEWKTFRTESEFIFYPTSVFTLFRTDRENNSLVLCGYYIAGSETIVSQGYEYWLTANSGNQSRAAQNPIVINTDDSMIHEFTVGELADGNYSVRAFVKTESGSIIYGSTLGFTSSSNGYSGIDIIEPEQTEIISSNGTIRFINAESLDCYIYNSYGQLLIHKRINDNYEEISLTPHHLYFITLSNGLTKKIIL